jgi:transposase
MFNRTRQVLLEKWLDDYIEILTKKYDLSTSSVIRAHICLAIVCLLPRLYPEYKSNSVEEEMVEFAKNVSKQEHEDMEVHHMLSNITYEARKAIEFWFTKEKT